MLKVSVVGFSIDSADMSTGISAPSAFCNSLITFWTFSWLNLGKKRCTLLSESSTAICICIGVLTIRPSNCAMFVISLALRNDIIHSARGQSHPVERFSLKKTILIFLSSAICDGSLYFTSSPFIVMSDAVCPKV